MVNKKRTPFTGVAAVGSWILCLSLACASCNRDKVYSGFKFIANNTWEASQDYSFHFKITDASVPYDMFIHLRHDNYYPYRNIWLLCETRQARTGGTIVLSAAIERDTMNYILANDFGKWIGKGVSLHQHKIVFKENYYFPDTGRYAVHIRHGMRDDRLKGVEDVGLLVEQSN